MVRHDRIVFMNQTDSSEKTASYHHGNLKEALIQNAFGLVESGGAEAITLRALGQRIGTSRSAIYRHFDSKDALINAVIIHGFEMLDDAVRVALNRTDLSFEERFSLMGEAYIGFAMQHPGLYRLLFGQKHHSANPESYAIDDPARKSGFFVLMALIKEGQESGIVRQGDPVLHTAIVWSMIHGFATLIIDGHRYVKENLAPLFQGGVATLLEGIKNP